MSDEDHNQTVHEAFDPRLVKRHCDGWLAISGPSAPVRIAAEGITQEQAEEHFLKVGRKWLKALEEVQMRRSLE